MAATLYLHNACRLGYQYWSVSRSDLASKTKSSLSIKPPSVDKTFRGKGSCVLVSARDTFYANFTKRLDKRRHLWLRETHLAKAKFSILVTSKGVHVALDCNEGAVIEAAGQLLNINIPGALLGHHDKGSL